MWMSVPSTEWCVECVLELLGWAMKLLGGARTPWCCKGPEPEQERILPLSQQGEPCGGHCKTIDTASRNECVLATVVRAFRGRLLHARAQTFSRFGGCALFTLGRMAECRSRHSTWMTRAKLHYRRNKKTKRNKAFLECEEKTLNRQVCDLRTLDANSQGRLKKSWDKHGRDSNTQEDKSHWWRRISGVKRKIYSTSGRRARQHCSEVERMHERIKESKS